MATILIQIACYASIVSTAEIFLVSKVSKHTRAEIHQQVATVNELYGGPRKVLNALKTLWHVALAA